MKKKIAVFGMMLAMMSLSTISAFAAASIVVTASGNSGSGYAVVGENDNIRVLNAKNKYIKNGDGTKVGYWIYGQRDDNVVSEYKVYVGEGRASVTNGEGYYDDGGWVGVEEWSKAAQPWTKKGVNKAYYDYR